ncbi:hypothetical protein K1T71_004929 [Dendrolimus kikuchii]|uniref:Uncharacterized protein n=1 Tax=Dendrolimus kikuchii TaxID=765133 RepID=A0ACC1D6Q9_9NEOP|nr:hypothetical protein K1T71_004929 [Dendrolimus kikuchii]
MLSGKVVNEITDILYGANLCALKKKDGGIRPIAVGTVYRRLAAKCCCKKKAEDLKLYFQPNQLGFGSRGGCEAAVHALRTFLQHNGGDLVLKVDVKNAFNSVDRSALLSQIKDQIPDCYHFLWQCYSQNSKLIFQDNVIYSKTGCQQGDPLGPAIFSLAIHPIITRLKSKFNVWYLDDGTLGGEVDDVLEDFTILTKELKTIGLEINLSKCEYYISNTERKTEIISRLNTIAPGIKLVNNSSLHLLGAPIFDESIPNYVEENIKKFRESSDRLLQINTHMAYTIIRYCLFVPKFTYTLRCCQLWKQTSLLQTLDNIVRDTLISIINLEMDDRAWSQCSLPVKLGGLGVRKISSVALPAFLSSAYSTRDLVFKILQKTNFQFEIPYLTDARRVWSMACPNVNVPTVLTSQHAWDGPLCELTRDNLLQTCTSSAERARLLAVANWESGQWLQAHPSFYNNTLLDNTTFRLAASLRLGAPCCVPHHCQCGVMVDRFGHHGLSCLKSAGRRSRHASLNDIIRRALVSVGVPAILEPNGLVRDDGKRPDGMSLVPWKMGRPLVWDATCVDTLAPSHLPMTESGAGNAAASAEDVKRRKYGALGRGYIFVPFGVETLGPWGPSAKSFFKDICKKLFDTTLQNLCGYEDVL